MALSTTRNSQRQLSTDYEWETLPSIDESLLFKASRELLDSSPSQHAEKHRKDSKLPIDPGAVPKRRPVDDPFLPQTTPQVPFTGQDANKHRPLTGSLPRVSFDSKHVTKLTYVIAVRHAGGVNTLTKWRLS